MERPAAATTVAALVLALSGALAAIAAPARAGADPVPAAAPAPADAPAAASSAASGAIPLPAAPPARRPVMVAVVAVAEDVTALRAPCQELYRVFAEDPRFRPEFRAEMREALEEPPPVDPHLVLAREALDRARRAYDSLAYASAVADAEAAIEEALRARPEPAVFALVADAATVEGVASHVIGQADAADRLFRLALAIDPTRTLDPIVYRADIRARFSQAAQRRAPAGRLVVRTDQAGARLLVDGHAPPAGSPIALPAGEHLVSLALPGFYPRLERRRIEPGVPVEIAHIFARADVVTHVRDLVSDLRAAVAAGEPGVEGNVRAALARVIDAGALIVVTGAESTPPDPARTASITVYDGKTAARLGDRVLELGRKSPHELADEIYTLVPAPAVPPVVPPAPPPPYGPVTAPQRPAPVWRRWWFMSGLGAVVLGGTVAAAVLLSETHYRGEVKPFRP